MKLSFKQFNSIMSLPEDATPEQVDEMFGAFFGNKELEKNKEELLKKKAKLLDIQAARRKDVSKKKDEIFAKKAAIVKFNDTYGSLKTDVPDEWKVNESKKKFSKEVEKVLKQLADGDLEIYQVMNHPDDEDQREAAKYLQHRYEDISNDRGLHPDDEFEEIEDELLAELVKQFED